MSPSRSVMMGIFAVILTGMMSGCGGGNGSGGNDTDGNDTDGNGSVAPLIDPTTVPAYLQLRRDVLINADLWDDEPRIITAGYGFEGIQGVPGVLNVAALPLAIQAGAGVNLDWALLDPVPPLRNLTTASSPIGLVMAGFGARVQFADAMPVVFSWPILPSSVSPTNFGIMLNTGEVVFPQAAALNPNYDYNERHVVVVFGEFGNRLAPGELGAIYPIAVGIVAGEAPLMAVGPNGPVSLSGLVQLSSNPYLAGPSLVGAKLSRFSAVGDFPPLALAGSFPNDGYSHFGDDAQFRLRLYTSGGFSPDGVSGFLPGDFERFFRLHATHLDGSSVLINEAGTTYDLGNGVLEVVGIAELGAPGDNEDNRAYYVEDHDNYFDIILKGDEQAMASIYAVEIPTSAVSGYLDLYNPGGPGRTPDPLTTYTKPAQPQMQPVWVSLDDLRTVSYAEQDLDRYDLDDDMPVVFRLRHAQGGDRLTTSTIEAQGLVSEGWVAVSVDFPNEMARPGVAEVRGFYHAASGNRIYATDPDEWSVLTAEDSGWTDEGLAFGAFDTPQLGAGPIYRFFDAFLERHHFTPDFDEGHGMDYQGIAWYGAILRPGL
ncbi:MAG: hypothetical protein ACK4SX_09590 [Alcanivoracaceae bacterium]